MLLAISVASLFLIKSLATMIVSPCVRIFISTMVCPTLARYDSFKLNIGGMFASCSISEIISGNRTGGLNFFFSAFLLGS